MSSAVGSKPAAGEDEVDALGGEEPPLGLDVARAGRRRW